MSIALTCDCTKAYSVPDRFAGRQFRCTEEEIDMFFPGFRKWVSKRDTVQGKFVQTVKGRMTEGFKPLFGKRGQSKSTHMDIKLDRTDRRCYLELHSAGVILRLRF